MTAAPQKDKPRNVVVIMADEHSKFVLGAYGNSVVKTPNLDRLAARGTIFDAAYCNNPVCVPSRASFATGRYTHETGHWDNTSPYLGEPASWAHRVVEAGYEAVSIGKLHYRDSSDPTGFSEQILPLHVQNGVGDIPGLLREKPRQEVSRLAREAGAGDSAYQDYDRNIRDTTVEFLKAKAETSEDRPWVLFVSLVCPHFPLLCEQRFFDMYPLDSLPFPTGRDNLSTHPVVEALRKNVDYDAHFRDEAEIRRGLAAYYGLVSFQDDNIGVILDALDQNGFGDDTLVMYTADHGENLGNRCMWGKSNMYEDSVGVPLIMAGPGVPEGTRSSTPVSLVDVFPTIIEAIDLTANEADADLPGESLVATAQGKVDENRTVFAEYHASGSITGFYMIRWSHYKYVHYVGYAPQLFDLEADPEERQDLADSPEHKSLLDEGLRRLLEICDPEAVDRQARKDQAARIETLGGRDNLERVIGFGYTPAPGEEPESVESFTQ